MRPLLALLACLWCRVQAFGSQEFVLDLETCIRNHAIKLAATFPEWGNKCDPVTSKVDYQAKIYEETLGPIFGKHGYTAALWCGMYSVRTPHEL